MSYAIDNAASTVAQAFVRIAEAQRVKADALASIAETYKRQIDLQESVS
jgi:hypothetical protein